MKITLLARPVAIAAALAVAPLSAVYAQSAPASSASENDGLKLDRVIVTGTSTARSKLKQSVSVSSLDPEALEKNVASSATELLRAVPGVRSESSGGEGNANFTIRGAPISAGGSRYVQFQEDGLPVLLVGDISFATADQFFRADYFNDSIDVIRGGSASTLATNSPGGIINFQSKTGKNGGGNVGYSLGLDYKQQRLDFDYGTSLGNGLYMQLGGFHRVGESMRNTNVTAENGGQLRMNLTKEFKDGYVRINLKSLNDSTPTFLPVPVKLVGSKITEIPGIDPRNAYFLNSNLPQDVTVDRNGNRVVSNPSDGLSVKNTSFGVEAQFKLAGDLTVTERFRKSDITGRFVGLFPAGSAPTDAGNGANRYTGTASVFSAHMFNTSLDDMGNVFNDLRVQKQIALSGGNQLTVTGGIFNGVQNVAQTWYWNRYNVGLNGNGAKVYDNAGVVSTQPVGNATTTWGGCCFRAIDVELTAAAPYAAVTFDAGPLSIDASIRNDKQRASGSQIFGNAGGWDATTRSAISYTTSATSVSLGANYELSKQMAAFARYSDGSSWASPDRVVWDTAVSSGAKPYPINELSQLEAGLKMRNGPLSTFVTFFHAKTKEDGGFEVTTQKYLKDNYTSNGIEAEVSYRMGDLRLNGGATWTRAKIDATGKTPRRQAALTYQIMPTYSAGPFEVGAAIVGTTKSYADNNHDVELPAYMVANLFASMEVAKGLQLQLGVNNLFNKLAYTEAEGQGNLTNNPLYVARAINGRSAKAALKYSF
jgi:outer membrane receptor protein involved in Fe transport